MGGIFVELTIIAILFVPALIVCLAGIVIGRRLRHRERSAELAIRMLRHYPNPSENIARYMEGC